MMDRKGYDKWLETADDSRSPLSAWLSRQPEIDELVNALRRQWKADRVLAEQPWDCTEEEHEKALDEHWSTHEAIKGILAKYPEAES
jgi:hypothetical protein